MAYLVILGVAILAIVIGYRLLGHEREEVHYFRCPSCGQKLRFGAGHEGRKIMCPRCLKSCTLSQVDPELPGEESAAGPYRFRRR